MTKLTRTESLVKSAQTHPKSALIFTLFFPAFFTCFGFPIFDFSKLIGGTWEISIAPFLLLWILYDLAVWAAALFSQYPVWPIMMGLSLLGLGCRLAMEWGEVSITTDFTAPNLIIHFAAFGVMFLWGIREAKKYI